MRPIKCRVWDFTKNKMHYAENGMVLEFVNGSLKYVGVPDLYLVDFQVMPFTGFLDKNGVEIYEEDIVKATHNQSEVTWERVGQSMVGTVYWDDDDGQDDPGYYCERPEKRDVDPSKRFFPLGYHRLDYEVIGNIYENPDLLTNPTDMQAGV